MFRSSVRFSASFCTLFAIVICAGYSPNLFAQSQTGDVQANAEAAGNAKQQVPPELWQLLNDWAKGSAGINSLYGQHERHVYDGAFEIEKVSNGKFWYESPDKGRIDVAAIKITQKMIEERTAPGAKVERKKNGQPYELKSDDSERWLCDGEKVYDINDAQKSAKIAHLPPELRGRNIMHSPLPFLFGMPADKAVERFNMKIERDYRPDYNVVLLSATPRWRQDLENWRSAQIYLDTKTFLPSAVKLVDAPGTRRTVYKFTDMKVGQRIIDMFKDPWNPRIEGYQIHVIQPGQEATEQPAGDQQIAGQGLPVFPNVVGKSHTVAEQMLISAGIPKENISKQNAGPAPRAELTYRVRGQEPVANTPLNRSGKVVLLIFDKPQQGANLNPAGGTQQRVGKVSLRPE